MFNILRPLGALLRIKQINTSDIFFVMNTKLTTALFVLFSVLLSTKELFGKAIDCENEHMNEFCWTTGTFIYSNPKEGSVGVNFVNYGVQSYDEKSMKLFQRYYQWMVMILIGQALVSYLPAFLWKSFERGLLTDLCHGLESTVGRDTWTESKKKVITYFCSKYAGTLNTKYAYHYALCKALNLLAIAFNVIILDVAIPNFWQKYARAIYALVFGSSDDWFKYSSFVFPKQTKCDFHNYGVSGGMQSKDSLCLMPLNNINDKIFVVIWIWYIVLLTATLLNGIYVVLLFTNRKLRMEVLKRQALMHISNKQICSATNDEHLGDCFVLKQMASNLNPLVFIEIMEDLSLERSIKLNDY